MGRLTMRYEGGETNYLKYNGETITDYHYQHGIDRLAEYEDIGTPQELAELKAENRVLKERLEKAEAKLFIIVRNNTVGEAVGDIDVSALMTIRNFDRMIDFEKAIKSKAEAEARLKELKGEKNND